MAEISNNIGNKRDGDSDAPQKSRDEKLYRAGMGPPCDFLQEDDDVLVTGRITSENGAMVRELPAVVATVYSRESGPFKEDGNRFKVWPKDENDPQLPVGNDGKLWFDATDASLVVKVVNRTE